MILRSLGLLGNSKSSPGHGDEEAKAASEHFLSFKSELPFLQLRVSSILFMNVSSLMQSSRDGDTWRRLKNNSMLP